MYSTPSKYKNFPTFSGPPCGSRRGPGCGASWPCMLSQVVESCSAGKLGIIFSSPLFSSMPEILTWLFLVATIFDELLLTTLVDFWWLEPGLNFSSKTGASPSAYHKVKWLRRHLLKRQVEKFKFPSCLLTYLSLKSTIV